MTPEYRKNLEKRQAVSAVQLAQLIKTCEGCRRKSSQTRLVQTSKGLLCGNCADEKDCAGEFMEQALAVPAQPKPEAPKPKAFGEWS